MMATLYKRANPSQRRILRIVEGAVKNAAYAHNRHEIGDRFARSVAKRATGTLTAQWPEVLAAQMPSRRLGSYCVEGGSAAAQPSKPSRGGSLSFGQRSPYKLLYMRLGLMAGWARKAGHESRAAALADALRVVASIEKELS